jgi:hypothetical protein
MYWRTLSAVDSVYKSCLESRFKEDPPELLKLYFENRMKSTVKLTSDQLSLFEYLHFDVVKLSFLVI